MPKRSMNAAAKGAVRPYSTRLRLTAPLVTARDQPNSSSIGSSSTPVELRKAAAATSAPSVTPATTQARCHRVRGGSPTNVPGSGSPGQHRTRVGTVTGTDQWASATAGLPAPLVAVDLDAFDANADDLVRRAGGLPVRVASKSVRCRTLLDRVLARPGFAGVMAYAVPEAVWLVEGGARDVFVAYPSVDVVALRAVATDERLRSEVTLTIDSVEHVRWLRDTLGSDAAGLRRRARRRRLVPGGPAAPRRPPLPDAHPGRCPRGGAGGRWVSGSTCGA